MLLGSKYVRVPYKNENTNAVGVKTFNGVINENVRGYHLETVF